MLQEKDITNFLHAKASVALLMVLAIVAVWFAYLYGAVLPIEGNLGFGFPSANNWLPFGDLSMAVGLALTILVAFLIIVIDRSFNVLRSITALGAGMFLVIQAAQPTTTGQLYGGEIFAPLMLLCTALLFSTYSDNQGLRRVYLLFLLVGLAAFTQVAFAFVVPLFWLGLMQMRIFSLRSWLASMMGLITPAWLLLGFGIITIDQLKWPGLVMVWSAYNSAEVIQSAVAAGITAVFGIIFTVANILKILSYNARVRALNGFLTLSLAYLIVLMALNFNNFTFYIPLLNALVAYQVAHFFTYRRHRRSYILILALMSVYAGLYVWALMA